LGVAEAAFGRRSFGARGAGKSTYLCQRARELVATWGGAYVIGHSIGQRFPAALPDGWRPPIEYHRSVSEVATAIRRRPGKWHIVAPPHPKEDPRPDLARSSADDVLDYAVSLSYGLRVRAWQEKHPIRGLFGVPRKGATFTGLRMPPVLVLVDEGIAVRGAQASPKGDTGSDFLELLISLRHMHVALLYSLQSPTARTWHLLEQSTDIHAFRIKHEYAANALRAAGATSEQLAAIGRLRRFERITFSPEVRDDDDGDDDDGQGDDGAPDAAPATARISAALFLARSAGSEYTVAPRSRA
jgi:hypothetical protein